LFRLLDLTISTSKKYYACRGERRNYGDPAAAASADCEARSELTISFGAKEAYVKDVRGFYEEDDDLPISAWQSLGDLWAAEDNNPDANYDHLLRFPVLPSTSRKSHRRATRSRTSIRDSDSDDAPIGLRRRVVDPDSDDAPIGLRRRVDPDSDDAPIGLRRRVDPDSDDAPLW
jgi:hypothetical protein